MGDPVTVVEALLPNQIVALVRREHLTDPVRDDLDRASAWGLWDTLSTPSDDVWTKRVLRIEIDVHLGREPPTAGPATPRAPIKGSQRAEQPALGAAMLGAGGPLFYDLAVDQLMAALVLRDRHQIVERGVGLLPRG